MVVVQARTLPATEQTINVCKPGILQSKENKTQDFGKSGFDFSILIGCSTRHSQKP